MAPPAQNLEHPQRQLSRHRGLLQHQRCQWRQRCPRRKGRRSAAPIASAPLLPDRGAAAAWPSVGDGTLDRRPCPLRTASERVDAVDRLHLAEVRRHDVDGRTRWAGTSAAVKIRCTSHPRPGLGAWSRPPPPLPATPSGHSATRTLNTPRRHESEFDVTAPVASRQRESPRGRSGGAAPSGRSPPRPSRRLPPRCGERGCGPADAPSGPTHREHSAGSPGPPECHPS